MVMLEDTWWDYSVTSQKGMPPPKQGMQKSPHWPVLEKSFGCEWWTFIYQSLRFQFRHSKRKPILSIPFHFMGKDIESQQETTKWVNSLNSQQSNFIIIFISSLVWDTAHHLFPFLSCLLRPTLLSLISTDQNFTCPRLKLLPTNHRIMFDSVILSWNLFGVLTQIGWIGQY